MPKTCLKRKMTEKVQLADNILSFESENRKMYINITTINTKLIQPNANLWLCTFIRRRQPIGVASLI